MCGWALVLPLKPFLTPPPAITMVSLTANRARAAEQGYNIMLAITGGQSITVSGQYSNIV